MDSETVTAKEPQKPSLHRQATLWIYGVGSHLTCLCHNHKWSISSSQSREPALVALGSHYHPMLCKHWHPKVALLDRGEQGQDIHWDCIKQASNTVKHSKTPIFCTYKQLLHFALIQWLIWKNRSICPVAGLLSSLASPQSVTNWHCCCQAWEWGQGQNGKEK